MDRDRWVRGFLPATCVTLALALILGPLLAVAIRSLLTGDGITARLSLAGYVGLLSDSRFYLAVLNTLVAAGATTLCSLALGFGLSFLVSRTDLPGARYLVWANALPLLFSPYVTAIAWTWLLAPHDGLFPTWAREHRGISLDWLSVYSLHGVIFVLTLCFTPCACLLLTPRLRELDAAFEDTARVNGAPFWYTLRHITLPLARPALLSTALIVFVASAGLFDVPAALGVSRGIHFVPTEIQAMASRPADQSSAAAFAVVIVAAVVALSARVRRRTASAAQDGSDAAIGDPLTAGGPLAGAAGEPDYRPLPIRLRWPARLAALALEAAYLSIGVLAPLGALLMVAISRQWRGHFVRPSFPLAHFHQVLAAGTPEREALHTSLLLALLGATLAAALAVAVGYLLTHDYKHRQRIEPAVSLTIGVPGIVLGAGLLALTTRTPLLGTLALLTLACVARFLPFATGHARAMFRAVHPWYRETARVSGASWAGTARHVIVPLLRPSLLGAWLTLFVLCFRDLGTVVLLATPDGQPLSVALLGMSDQQQGPVAALALLQTGPPLLAGLIFLLSRASLFPRPA